ncbi:hypothetical protein C8F04DRAFT_1249500 [Mycena alexandri]|uniref:Uncharacterized protein n=1 Tax=Mycena alexandri TaxID=1745969 RepID=A0AAD6XH37_9AGAR|nr:hypothetical protein C8F04DRAFT_1249500 [Mycena alexandri]
MKTLDVQMDLRADPLTMRIMNPYYWKVEDAPSIVNGVNLLINQNRRATLGPLDGRVAAHFEMGNASYFVTTNALYVPRLPEVDPKQIVVRRDMRFGPDDPVLWPRLYSDKFCHLPAIPKAPTDAENPLSLMWWNPDPDDFVCPASGRTLTRGLGRLRFDWYAKLAALANVLLSEHDRYLKSLPTDNLAKPPLLLAQLVERLRLSLERLRIPSTFIRMVVGVTTVQREYLELTGLLRYMTKYRPRLDGIADPAADTTSPDNCIGCFTDNPRIAQIFWKVRLPCWLIRPLQAFADERILKMVVPFAARTFLEMKPAAGFEPVPATDRLDERLALLHHCTENTPWYRNPFQVVAAASSSGSAGGQLARDPPARTVSSTSKAHRSPYAGSRPQSKARGSNVNAKVGGSNINRDKFVAFDSPEMPTMIPSWSSALAAVDRRQHPSCGIDLPQLYVMPEPALLASPDDELRRRVLYHHYELLRDALMFRLAFGDEPRALLTTQEWRDILSGKITKQGKAGSRARARSASLEDLMRPALDACGIDDLTGFPVSPDAIPPLNLNKAKEILWELAEINFRYELLALDARASGLDRPDECRRCFATTKLIGIDLHESQRGLAALETDDRLPHLLCIARLMHDWTVPCERPKEIDDARGRTALSPGDVYALEGAVARYYTQSFYELFGRAAVVPMRLEHAISA